MGRVKGRVYGMVGYRVGYSLFGVTMDKHFPMVYQNLFF